MALTTRTLEITVISGEDIRLDRKPVKNKSFAIVKIDSQNFDSTNFGENAGSYPSWNQKIELKLPVSARFLTVEVHCGASSRNAIVGTANIPVSDFIGGNLPEGYLHFLSYRLRNGRGERNGIINISVRIKGPGIVSTSRSEIKIQSPEGKTNFGSGGVAIGIPIWSDCPNKIC